MILFKSCPRCHGDVYINRDIYGDYKECLTCGMMEDIESPDRGHVLVEAETAEAKKGKRKVA